MFCSERISIYCPVSGMNVYSHNGASFVGRIVLSRGRVVFVGRTKYIPLALAMSLSFQAPGNPDLVKSCVLSCVLLTRRPDDLHGVVSTVGLVGLISRSSSDPCPINGASGFPSASGAFCDEEISHGVASVSNILVSETKH